MPKILQCKEFVNADEIARGLSPFNPESVAIEAGRLMLSRIKELLSRIISKDSEVITLFYGADVKEDEINNVCDSLMSKYRDVEINSVPGMQDVYSFIVSFE